ncbi:SCO family protein [Aurantiacibacter atlanticus]|nr:SCO family protein [Aurantiacibacter atlanticus]
MPAPPLYDSAVVGGFDLVDTQGKQVLDSDFAGKYQMIYFGYAYCPDVCPFDVQRMMQGYNLFTAEHPDLAGQIQPIFITVDPDRDTPDVVAEFTANFSEDLIGLTGSAEAIEAAAANYFAYYEKLEENSEGGYLMDHSRSGYLVDREGQPMALLSVEDSAQVVATELETWVR